MNVDTTDVIVIGSGFAGLSAAIEAASTGSSVVVLEKRKACGGNSAISDGVIAAAASTMQKNKGIEDSALLMEQDIMRAGRGFSDSALAKTVAQESSSILQWLTGEIGVKFQDRVDQFGGHSVPRSYTPQNASGIGIIKPLLARARRLGVEIRTQTSLQRLLPETDNIAMTVKAFDHSMAQSQWIQAKRGVILATGGFAGDISFRVLQNQQLDDQFDHTNRPGTTAESLVEAIKIGADSVNLDYVQLAPWTSPDERGYGVAPLLASYAIFPYGVLINPMTGKRFVNELGDRKVLTDAMQKIGYPCIGIADKIIVQNSQKNIDKYLKRRVISVFKQLDNLAGSYQIPFEALKNTVACYNTFVQKQKDEEFDKPIRDCAKPLSPPYYAVRLWPKVHYTMGGLKIDNQARVLDKNDCPLRGLYAAGEVTGGIHGANRLDACSIPECLVFGRIAGRNATAAC